MSTFERGHPSYTGPGPVCAERPDPAASYRSHTPRQAAHAAARFDREASEMIAVHKSAQEAERRALLAPRMIAVARRHIEQLGVCVLTGTVTGRDGRRALTRAERSAARQRVKDAWGTLRYYEADFVTVLNVTHWRAA